MRRRFVLPGAGIVLALASIALLGSISTAPVPRRHGPLQPVPGVPGRPAGLPTLAPGKPAALPSPRALPPGPPGPTTPAPGKPLPALAPGTLDREVDKAPDLIARLRAIDQAIPTTDPAEVLATVERLLDHPPGEADEGRALKTALLGRLTVYKDNPRAMMRLLAATEPTSSRADRLIAIDALARNGNLSPIARPYIQRIATSDTDDVVQAKAKAVLGAPRG
jgi:hypothetical protein